VGDTARLAFIPSPAEGVWYLGPVPLRAYALCIIAGIVVAIWLGGRRYVARGGQPGTIGDIAVWAVPFGIIGGRIYHVATDWQIYFGADGKGFLASLRIWDGGLGIWGAVLLGAVGAWIACRRQGIPLPPVGDAIAPGIALAQALGRWGNWFNQELFGAPTTVPWALEIDPAHRPIGYEQYATFQPTFLYESVGLVVIALVLIWADRRFRMGHGRVFALYVLLYTVLRGIVETLRIDEAHQFFGIRLNVFTAVVVGVGALAYLVISARLRPGREAVVDPRVVLAAASDSDPVEPPAAAGTGSVVVLAAGSESSDPIEPAVASDEVGADDAAADPPGTG
jgi:phosphatidylglycerol---prolipoprotein diacylglyceryl transferase